ncbi:Wzz/FepE/Etk N-terminal domain-containing protein [Halorhodospira neutriphila]|uniref:Polysaccharide chain length determinant N-terminal domain-containing protein n=1 Tax=Halorhodospira neutriphila TaxID=168379 RepID=A0ABS1E2B5_9GAMM|nr:Wzz/FepE/Etk N-terminal domain-containing protein [Halorhodospira neutriphila]MBK1725916.1 hypothetical protein [Halorhodospira neutriphila]
MFVLTPQSLFRILAARAWLVLGLVFLCSAAGAIVALGRPPSYTAATELVVESPTRALLSETRPQAEAGYMDTQLQVIRSGRVRRHVWGHLGEEPRARIRAWVEEELPKVDDPQAWLRGKLQADLQVAALSNSDVAHIRLSGENPRILTPVVDAVAQAYIEANLELRKEPAHRFSKWYDQQLDVLRDRVREAREAVIQFRQQHDIVGVSERLDVETERLRELASMMVAARGEKVTSTLRQTFDISIDGSGSPEVATNPLLSSLREDLARAKVERADLARRYGENHPRYRRAEAEVEALKGSLRRQSAIVERRLKSAVEMSDERFEALKEAFERQKERVQALNAQWSKLEPLKQDVRNAEEAYEQAATQASANRLKSRLSATEIAVLNRAETQGPDSKVLLSSVVGFGLGLMLGTAMAVGLEMVDRRIRSRGDLEEGLGMPVLAEIPGARRSLGEEGRQA